MSGNSLAALHTVLGCAPGVAHVALLSFAFQGCLALTCHYCLSQVCQVRLGERRCPLAENLCVSDGMSLLPFLFLAFKHTYEFRFFLKFLTALFEFSGIALLILQGIPEHVVGTKNLIISCV